MPKLAAALTTIPQCVIGGATLSVFAAITMTGIRMITGDGVFTAGRARWWDSLWRWAWESPRCRAVWPAAAFRTG